MLILPLKLTLLVGGRFSVAVSYFCPLPPSSAVDSSAASPWKTLLLGWCALFRVIKLRSQVTGHRSVAQYSDGWAHIYVDGPIS